MLMFKGEYMRVTGRPYRHGERLQFLLPSGRVKLTAMRMGASPAYVYRLVKVQPMFNLIYAILGLEKQK